MLAIKAHVGVVGPVGSSHTQALLALVVVNHGYTLNRWYLPWLMHQIGAM